MTHPMPEPEDAASPPPERSPRPSRTIHDNCETWTDTCSCEPEPRWQALGEELEPAARRPRSESPLHDC